MRLLSPTLALVAISPHLFSADQATVPNEDMNDDNIIVVTATRSEQNAHHVPATVVTVDQADLKDRSYPVHAIKTLSQEPGVSYSQDGSLGNTSSLRIRGAKGDSTQFMYDGVPVNDPIGVGGQITPAFLNPAGLVSQEMVKGPQSGLYGSRSVGGVVNMRRLIGSDEHSGLARIEAGSFNTVRLLGQASGPINEQFSFAAGVSFEQSDGFSQLTDDPDGDPKNYEEDTFERNGFYGRVDMAINDNWAAFVNADIMVGETDYDNSDPDDDVSSFTYDNYTFQGGVDGALGDNTESVTRLSYSIYNRENPGTAYGSSAFDTNTVWASQQFNHSINQRFELTAGLDYRLEEGETTEVGGGDPVDGDAKQLGVFAQGLWHEELVGTVSRFEGQLNLRYDDHSEEGDASTYRLGAAVFFLDDRVKVLASYGTGFRAPTLYELFAPPIDFGFGPSPVGNDDLEAETSSGYEFGHVSDLGHGFNLSNIYFRTAYDQAIVYGFSGYENADSDEEIQGLESWLDWTSDNERWYATCAHTWNDLVDGDELMVRLPENQVHVAVQFNPIPEAWVRIDAEWNDERLDRYYDGATSSTVDTTLDSYSLIDLAGGYTFHQNWTAHGRIENLLDEDYVSTYGYATAGIGFYAAITASY